MFKDKVLNELKTFWNDEEAQGMMEYVLIAAAVIAIAAFVGPEIQRVCNPRDKNLEDGLEQIQQRY